MGWIPIDPTNSPRRVSIVVVSRTVKGMPDAFPTIRIRVDSELVAKMKWRIGGFVDIYKGEGQNSGKIRIRKSRVGVAGFPISKFGSKRRSGAQIVLPGDLLYQAPPPATSTDDVSFTVDGEQLELVLPVSLGEVAKAPAGDRAAEPAPSPERGKEPTGVVSLPPPPPVMGGGPSLRIADSQTPRRQTVEIPSDIYGTKRRWTPEDDRRLWELHAAGLSPSEIGRKLKRTIAAIQVRLSKSRGNAPPDEHAAAGSAHGGQEATSSGSVAEVDRAADWLRENEDVKVESVGNGRYRIDDNDEVTGHHLIQMANDRRARRDPDLPRFSMPSFDDNQGCA